MNRSKHYLLTNSILWISSEKAGKGEGKGQWALVRASLSGAGYSFFRRWPWLIRQFQVLETLPKKNHLEMIKTFRWESVAIKSDEVAQSVLRNVCALGKHNWEARDQKLSLLTEVVSKHLDTWMTVTASLQNCSVLNSLDALSRNLLLRTDCCGLCFTSVQEKRGWGGLMCQTSSDVKACQKIGWNHSLCYSLAP